MICELYNLKIKLEKRTDNEKERWSKRKIGREIKRYREREREGGVVARKRERGGR